MAAEPQPDWLSCLPPFWSYGVTQDGRVFFINEEAKSTTWLQPVSGEAVITGHRKTPDLPTGWEEGYTFEGARCFIKASKFGLKFLLTSSCQDGGTTPQQFLHYFFFNL
ncbi:pleckstrin homology domain-containing family A member 5-like isoform X7 [Syngnathoides biaculeatus]|uniref:pleckstrin homology domain-containing family A member 5-like isoform X7 n=1 Tax=Syngnathoides biaculeatus TaxID=300417 RepID=UPI002ADDCF94|nr:pleckstrin homology domain-containing family A member 5-like isoform X7 [Syngnathoides biaculeatus]